MDSFWYPFILSLELATVTTIILLAASIPLCCYIFFYSSGITPLLKSLINLPFVLPPTVLGFYMLIALSESNLAFSFTSLVAGSIIYSLPFMMNPILSGLENLPQNFQDAAFTLGKSKVTTFYKVMIPNIKPSILIGIVMSFAHTIGEFGMVLMIGGNIPGKTRVASIAIYNEVESMNYAAANSYSLILLIFSLLVLLAVHSYQHYRNINFL
ncbi:molybdate ABC transporter permease subunit [Aliifodinibius salicampi]|uniref:Molybdenum transport system permease n=1 Tax=Fodinibius salicampi TaxID=1920655 RepID=A0ABT3Q284_9BACT|nr:molybdate ABC transporter permease subunit [Fodinibius salicampi]MCW9714123.1 molybdate ABC transporter permease subunit [Fodinibius salicampi]